MIWSTRRTGLLSFVASVSLLPAIAHAQLDVPPEPPLPPAPNQLKQNDPGPAPPASATTPPASATDPAQAPAPPPSFYQSLVRGHKPSPNWTQDRSFSSTRFWLLDPGNWEVETWVRSRIYPEKSDGTRDPAKIYLQQEIEIGVLPHLQFDAYLNFVDNPIDGAVKADGTPDNSRRFQYAGYQLEARIAIPSYYGQIPLNPVIYLEWLSQRDEPGRVEARILLGGTVGKWVYLAANPYFEANVEPSDVEVSDGKGGTMKAKSMLLDAEVGTTLAAGFRITDWFRVSAEAKIGGDMLGDPTNKLHFVAWAGPGFILKPFNNQLLKIMGTCLFLLPGSDKGPGHDLPQQFEPVLIVGSQF